MVLVFILSLFALELNVQRYLVRLINNVAMAGYHLPNVEVQNTWDRCQVFLGRDDQLIWGVRLSGVGPKDNNVRKHPAIYNENLGRRNRANLGRSPGRTVFSFIFRRFFCCAPG